MEAKTKRITVFYFDRPIDNNWYELVPMHMRVITSYHKFDKKRYEDIIFDFSSAQDREVTNEDLDNILKTADEMIDTYAPESMKDKFKQKYRNAVEEIGRNSHLRLANMTALFCKSLLPPD
ncbi:hypothetical protein HYV49_05970 [Candidatus Pacearchaeota archaeon]|nr:hypothetical protein [Candidatus Pacearchaeota archaeon]